MVRTVVANVPTSAASTSVPFEQRFDVARAVLERKYRWARRVLRNLEPVAVKDPNATLAVDKYLRLYHGALADQWSDPEFIGALWHEVQHILRHHSDRLEHFTKPDPNGPRDKRLMRLVNIAGDCEINDDLQAQNVPLPAGVFNSDTVGHEHFLAAEDHYGQLLNEVPEPEPQAGSAGKPQDGEDGQDGPDDGKSSNGPQNGPQSPGQPQDGSGSDSGDQGAPDDDSGPHCGSGSGGEPSTEEQPEPTPEEQAHLDREERKQDEDIVNEVEQAGGMSTVGTSLYRAAVKRLNRQKHDWRNTFSAEVRNAIEQRSDEAEEYTFKRASRRATSFPDIILPGSFRPIPQLGVVVDVSGSMDRAKLSAAMREVHAILQRLAIPEFYAYPTNEQVAASVSIRSDKDVERVFQHAGGSTDMMNGVRHAVGRGDEVVIVLTDCQTEWSREGPPNTVVIVGGIDRGTSAVPDWARVVEIAVDDDPDREDY